MPNYMLYRTYTNNKVRAVMTVITSFMCSCVPRDNTHPFNGPLSGTAFLQCFDGVGWASGL